MPFAPKPRSYKKSWQHPKDFPSGPPPQYYPGPAAVNFGVLKRSGVFAAVWPPANRVLLSGLIPIDHNLSEFWVSFPGRFFAKP